MQFKNKTCIMKFWKSTNVVNISAFSTKTIYIYIKDRGLLLKIDTCIIKNSSFGNLKAIRWLSLSFTTLTQAHRECLVNQQFYPYTSALSFSMPLSPFRPTLFWFPPTFCATYSKKVCVTCKQYRNIGRFTSLCKQSLHTWIAVRARQVF